MFDDGYYNLRTYTRKFRSVRWDTLSSKKRKCKISTKL
jgi:hypothetical protein